MDQLATIKVVAFNNETDKIVVDGKNKPIIGERKTSTDIPADVLGEVVALTMQRAWRTGLDGMNIKLVVTFS